MEDAIVEGIQLNMKHTPIYINQNTEKMPDFQLFQVGKVANSVAMEKTNLERPLQYSLNEVFQYIN